ncbi:MAG: leucine-rich repeat domain-containing protein, partial [Gammaproteobacteria bacterium]|nr:leucine-rich repeat domain-containing protein [Gammaproteobacteria bacterium]
AKEKIITFFLKKAFRPATDDGQFYIVLADSGMGKTTFLLNLYLRYHEQFFGTPYRMKLFPLGNPEIDKELDKMSDDEKHQTILLLDAFDEDIRAVEDYRARLEELIRKTRHFREIVITCRTQFFPSEEEEPKEETGVMRYGTEGGEHVFYKFYLSPFDEHDIRAYLRKRFPWYQRAKRQRARQIVKFCPNLMVRPMLLSYIEDLLQSERAYTTAYQVYMELIDRWIVREIYKVA